MDIVGVGHVVLKVSDLQQSVAWYQRVLGLRQTGAFDDWAVFLSWGDSSHDLALAQADDARPPRPEGVGLGHVALRIEGGDTELLAVKRKLEDAGVEVHNVSDHFVSHSIYFRDPDGLTLEVYVDMPRETWADVPNAVATMRPLSL